METQPRLKENDPKYLTYEIGSKNERLWKFLQDRYNKPNSAFAEISQYFEESKITFKSAPTNYKQPYFDQDYRELYFDEVAKDYGNFNSSSILFIDPDIGTDIGISRRYRSMRHMYLRGVEIQKLQASLKPTDYLVYFQHLGNSNYSLERRLADIKSSLGEWVIMAGYQRIQAAIVLVLQSEGQLLDKREKIKQYFKQYEYLDHKEKIIHR